MNIFIACSARSNIDKKHLTLAKEVSKYFHNKGYTLVFGAYSNSMMKECYEEFNQDGKVIGVTIEDYKEDLKEFNNLNCYVEKTSFDRIKKIYELSDICLILPGGIGSLNELFSILEEKRCTPSDKKLILLNYEGFYDNLIKYLKESMNFGFISGKDLANLEIVNDLKELTSK